MMEIKEIKKIKKQLPARYGRMISDMITKDGHKGFDRVTIVKVFNGQITNSDKVSVVLEYSLGIIQRKKILSNKIKKTLKAA